VVFLNAINVKIRDGKVANRPIYVALAATVEGARDILGPWAGDGGEGAKFWYAVCTEFRTPRRLAAVGPRSSPASGRGPLIEATSHRLPVHDAEPDDAIHDLARGGHRTPSRGCRVEHEPPAAL
jgi:hypothetical protein